jgi:hypothetical protein
MWQQMQHRHQQEQQQLQQPQQQQQQSQQSSGESTHGGTMNLSLAQQQVCLPQLAIPFVISVKISCNIDLHSHLWCITIGG